VTLTTTTTADADADADTHSSSGAMARGGEYRTYKDVRGAGVGCVGRKQRPGNGGNNDRGGIVPAAGECGGDSDGAALPPLFSLFPPAR
jgi:hypothetical protein